MNLRDDTVKPENSSPLVKPLICTLRTRFDTASSSKKFL
ncbi:hypothetical protein PENSTE_c022G04537 [Penicillium steckii]|uniref:Uncharacterized protein n=1 Tax=Penicillium steckii TaxID=303698 RepID=A0A1V6STI3_9EURO|nr:hypothetical protein PENSTE_c022G04537 [Penicillium steckii]